MKTFILCALLVGALGSPYISPRFRRGMNKIIGGTIAKPGELPYQLSFQDLSFGQPWHFCGASIYNENWAITAAHCVKGEDYDNPTYLQVVAGEQDQDETEGHEQAIILSKIVIHKHYVAMTMKNDISLLQLTTPLTFNNYVQAIDLPEAGYSATGKCTVSGWGLTNENGHLSHVLRKVDVPVVTDEECQHFYAPSEVYDSNLCAGYPQGGQDACQGDSGGPLVCHDNGDYLAGIVSWGYGCARPFYPGVYTEVAHFIEWIKTNSA